MADWYKGQVIIRGSLEAMSYFVKGNFYDDNIDDVFFEKL